MRHKFIQVTLLDHLWFHLQHPTVKHVDSKELQDCSCFARGWNERPLVKSLQNTYFDQDAIHACLHSHDLCYIQYAEVA